MVMQKRKIQFKHLCKLDYIYGIVNDNDNNVIRKTQYKKLLICFMSLT
jgi:hypothetical protein